MRKLFFISFLLLIIIVSFRSNCIVNTRYEKVNYPRQLGTIVISSIDLDKPIVLGMTKENLDQGNITLYEKNSTLDIEHGNLVIAGHARKGMFKDLNLLEIGDEIRIVTSKTYTYYVTEKVRHSINIPYYIDTSIPYRQLILITCTNNPNNRLIVIAKEK